jgi:hypothetical protein
MIKPVPGQLGSGFIYEILINNAAAPAELFQNGNIW